ncbi:MAG: phosphatase PAP2 family protein [Clostridiales bacterium]|nr:phosphatase PAP2 family protein [Clostridiales bacterium]
MAIQLLTIEGLKYLWGRVRFRDLLAAGSYDEFTPWYQINGINGNKSFPSGHTAGAGMSYLLMFMPYLSKNKNKSCAVCFLMALIYTSAVAYTRLVMGAHYLSDVTAGGLISFTIVIIAVAIFDKRSAKKLNLS